VKTAGTSIEISLSRFCGKDDIIVPFHKEDETMRQRLKIFPQNYIREYTKKWTEYTIKDFLRLVIRGQKPPKKKFRMRQHSSAAEVKEFIGSNIWESYFKFCFVRNPWDRAISHYYWFIREPVRSKNLDDFLLKQNKLNYSYIYMIDNKIAVDFVGRYENLMTDLGFVCQKLGIPFDNWLPESKRNYRTDRRHYSELLNAKQAELIRKACANEIELFNYSF
jgi:hypothetical protein